MKPMLARPAGGRVACVLAGALGIVLLGMAGCGPAAPAAAPAGTSAGAAAKPAKVEGAPKEADLATITLTPDAETHLGLTVAKVEKSRIPKTSTYAGEVMIPTGQMLAVTSPFVGTIKAPPAPASPPVAGAAIQEGQPAYVLIPILTPESRATIAPLLIDAENQVKQTQEQLHIAKVSLDRAEDLVKNKLGGSAQLVDARAQYDLAMTNHTNAKARLEAVKRVASDSETGALSVQTITAPTSGTVLNVHVRPGQVVAGGAALFEVARLDPVWVKVSVYVGDVPRIATDRNALFGGLADTPGDAASRPGKPIAAPPTGDPLAATVHLYYEVANKDAAIRPGERVGVTLPLKGDDECLNAPNAAVMRDIHGGTWVYEQIADHKYARRRVLVDRVVGDRAVLVSGPKPGVSVVTNGAAELWGAEFGGAK